MKRKMAKRFNPDDVLLFVDEVFDGDMHAKRVQSVAGAVVARIPGQYTY